MADPGPRGRRLHWDGCCNVRDLGGLRTEDGSATRFAAVVRADDVTRLSPAGRDALVDFGVRLIVDLRHEDPPYEVHCAGGVDFVAALLLRLADVEIEAVVTDYTESEASWVPAIGEWVDAASDEAERRKRQFLSVMPPAAMGDVLAELDDEHGGARGYLAHAGVSEEDLDVLRARLRG